MNWRGLFSFVPLLLFFFISGTALADLGDSVVFTELAPFNQKTSPEWSSVLTDIMNHEAPYENNKYPDLVTLAHETTHGIHAYLRNHFSKTSKTKKKTNGFYVLNNQAVMVEEPSIRKCQVAPYVPQSLRGERYRLYILGQQAWDDTALYIWDEWNAYLNGGAAGVELVQNGLWKLGRRDAVAGVIEFVVYALATAQAVKELDPEYFKNNLQFREFLAWNLKRSMQVFKEGSQIPEFKWEKQEKFYLAFLESSDAEGLRNFAREAFGSSWCLEVLGF